MSAASPRYTTILLLLAAAAVATVPAWAESPSQRVIAVGDVHGDIADFRAILQAAGLIDGSDAWTGGEAILVQTGDLVERGTAVREVLDLMISLQQQAAEAGGRVIALLGNHDVSNLLTYLDYQSTPLEVYTEILAGFVDDESEDRRRRALKRWSRWRGRFPQCGTQHKQEWEKEHPPGFVEYFEALGPDGEYGRWLRSLPTMARVGSTLFGHAGPSPWLASQGLRTVYSVNRAVSMEIEAFDESRAYLLEEDIILPFFTLNEIHCAVTEALVQNMQPAKVPARYQRPMSEEKRQRLLEIRQTLPNVDHSLTLRSEGPLWYRGYARIDDSEARVVADLLRSWQVDNIVVAHSPQKGQIQKRFDNVFLIDTGMAYGPKVGGQPSALEIEGGTRFSAIYRESTSLLAEVSSSDPSTGEPESAGWLAAAVDNRWLDPRGSPLPFANEADLLQYLRSARIVSSDEIASGVNRPRKLLLEQYGIRAHAIFRHFESEERNKRLPSGEVIRYFSDSYRNEVAAFEVARMIGLDHVYPATLRTVQGREGSIQLWVENAMSERSRIASDLHPPDIDTWFDQGADMRVFDNLVGNFDRNQTNILVDPEWKIWLIDHTRSFGREQQIPDEQYLLRCSRELWEGILALDEQAARERLAASLTETEIDAFLARRTRVVEALESRIAELGEDEVIFRRNAPATPGEMRLVDSDLLTQQEQALGAQE